jgi:hypothetical protein
VIKSNWSHSMVFLFILCLSTLQEGISVCLFLLFYFSLLYQFYKKGEISATITSSCTEMVLPWASDVGGVVRYENSEELVLILYRL